LTRFSTGRRCRPSPGGGADRLDFGNVEFLTASALGHLVVLHKEAKTLGGQLMLYNVGTMVYEVLAATRLTRGARRPTGTPGNFEDTLEQEGNDQQGRTKK
jgi:STAS domain